MLDTLDPSSIPFSSFTQALTSRAVIRVFGILAKKLCVAEETVRMLGELEYRDEQEVENGKSFRLVGC